MSPQRVVIVLRLLIALVAIAGIVSGSLVLFSDASVPPWWTPTLFLVLAALFLLWMQAARKKPPS
ncbi:CHASE2 domain-containing sensor protein [Prescottella agglutinans]|uniref:CHASE2 domain-containing sensor protein n=1 Tax=Prescottella agglutinans TaxID=1644129 RepID=A0ABT6MJ93_9NOCA|nr:CHASE2 domain-containing sensor protein [Prescottella agglutinans]